MIADELISFLLEKYKRESNNDNLKEVLDTNLNDEDSKIADLYINLSKILMMKILKLPIFILT